MFTAVAAIDAVYIFHQRDGFFLSYVCVKISAKFIGDVVFSIGKGAGAAGNPFMMPQVGQLTQAFTFSPSIGQWRCSRGLPASKTPIFRSGLFLIAS